MLARPAQTDVWLCAELVAHSSFLSLRAKIEKEGGRVVDRPTRINGLCVFQHFQGDAFEALVKHRSEPYRIMGLPCLLTSLNRGHLPRFDDSLTPIYSLCLEEMAICSTGLAGDQLARMKQRVLSLGGHFSAEFSLANTHLVAARIDTPKYSTAAEHRRPILRPAYVDDCWNMQEKDPWKPLARLPESGYILSPFAHLLLCATGLSESRKTYVAEEAKRIGAGFSKDLVKQVTHLIAHNTKRSNKTTFAQRWAIPIVSLAWLKESATAGAPLPATQFLLHIQESGESDASSRASGSESSNLPLLLANPPAQLPPPPPPPPPAASSAFTLAAPPPPPPPVVPPPASTLSGVRFACVSFTPLEVTEIGEMLASYGALLVQPDEQPRFLIVPHGAERSTMNLQSAAGPRLVTTQYIQRCSESSLLLSPDECFIFSPLPVPLPSPVFASVSLSSHGFNESEARSLALAAKTLGARHYRNITPRLTHLLCFGSPPAVPASVAVVSPMWLLRSAIDGHLLPPKDFPPESSQPQPPIPSPPPSSSPAPGMLTLALARLAASTESDLTLLHSEPLRSRLRSCASLPTAGSWATRANLEDEEQATSQSHSQVSTLMDVRYDAPLSVRTSPNRPTTRCFLLSNISTEARHEVEQGIRTLRGDLAAGTWSESVTHVITAEPRNTLKFLCALAAGLWALPPSYIKNSVSAGRWLNEADYAWKPEECPASADLLRALHLWRAKLSPRRGAFAEWHVLLLMGAEKDTYATLLRAGGARIETDVTRFLNQASHTLTTTTTTTNSAASPSQFLAILSESHDERRALAAACERLLTARIPIYRQQYALQWLETVGAVKADDYIEPEAELHRLLL